MITLPARPTFNLRESELVRPGLALVLIRLVERREELVVLCNKRTFSTPPSLLLIAVEAVAHWHCFVLVFVQ